MEDSTREAEARIARPLGHYRVLELPGLATLFAGKAFADLGAEVVRLEPPGGDPVRSLPPLVEDAAGAPGLVWSACSLGRRFLPLPAGSNEARQRLLDYASDADALLESPGDGFGLAAWGLKLEELRRLNPRLVVTSITPFGGEGPFAGWLGSDLVQIAMSCYLHMTGPADGPPLKPSAPYQSQQHAAMHAVAATLIALRRRRLTGRGAHVDQSMRDTGMWMLTHTYQFWDMLGVNLRRLGSARDLGGVRRLRSVYTCSDGLVVWLAITGHIGSAALDALVTWMDSEGLAPDWLKAMDWRTFDYLQQGPENVEQLEEAFAAFFARHGKAELLEWALANRLMLAPVQSLQDVLDDPQLAHRKTWRSFTIEGVKQPVRLPGPPLRFSNAAWEPRAVGGSAAAWLPRPQTAAVTPVGAPRDGLPLAGIRVIDFSTTIAAPAASRHLADFGAEVIRVESLAHPETLRSATPMAGRIPGVNRSGYFGAYNAGKKSVALDMSKPESPDILRRFIERADILLEAYVPGVVARWGFAWSQVHAMNPRLIMASHCLQGQTGPRRSHRGYGQIASAMSGWYDLTGLPGEEPVGPYSAYTDFVSWPFLLTGLLTALELRDQTGEGCYIDHAQLESSVHFLAPLLLDLQVNGRLATRQGNREAYAAPSNVYPCADDDRWLALTVASDEQWRSLCRALGQLEGATDPRFSTHAARKANEEALDALVATWLQDGHAFDLAERLQDAGIAAGPVLRAQDLFADQQLARRRFFRRLQHAEMGEHAVLTQTFRIEGVEAGPRTAAPLLGEHTHQVMREVLGMSDEEIARYAAAGVFE